MSEFPTVDETPQTLGSRAVVVGASMAGMLAARVLSETFERVTILDRDVLPYEAVARAGVPQGKHLHVLLPRGLAIAEDFFPGLPLDLEAAGAVPMDIARDLAWLTPQGWGARFESGLRILAFSRELLDRSVRKRLAEFKNIEWVDECDVIGLRCESGVVNGVRAKMRGQNVEKEFSGELTVLATGRNARTSEWLRDVGVVEVETTMIDAHVGYASRYYRRPKNFKAPWRALFIQAAPPEKIRAGVLFPVEGDRWLATLQGGDSDYPPTEEAGFVEFARGLRSRLFYETIHEAEPLTPVVGYRSTQNMLRRYDQAKHWPDRLLVIGDAVCAFNPVYGQGITTAGLAACALREILRTNGKNLDVLGRKFQRRIARINRAPWVLATSEDLRFRSVEGARRDGPTRCLHWYVDELLNAARGDSIVRKAFLDVQGMLRGPERIFAPGIAARVLTNAVKRRANGSPDA